MRNFIRGILVVAIFAFYGSLCSRTGFIAPSVPVATTVSVPVSNPTISVAGTLTNPQSFFVSFDPVSIFGALRTQSTVKRAQKKMHDDIDAVLDAALKSQDAAAVAAGAQPAGGMLSKPTVIADACHAYLKGMDTLSTAQQTLTDAKQKYQRERTSYLQKSPGVATAFISAESAAQSDTTKRATFERVYLKQAGLSSEWSKWQSAIISLNNISSSQNNSWLGLSGANTCNINIQGLVSVYNTKLSQVDAAAAARITLIVQSTQKGIPVP